MGSKFVEAQLDWKGRRISEAAQRGITQGLNIVAENVQAKAVPQTPILEGPLRASLTVAPATRVKNEAAVYTNLPYAVRQHEEMGYKHPRGGRAKYLERAANSSRRAMHSVISEQIRRATSE